MNHDPHMLIMIRTHRTILRRAVGPYWASSRLGSAATTDLNLG